MNGWSCWTGCCGCCISSNFFGVVAVGGLIGFIAQRKIYKKLDEVDFDHSVNDIYQNEDYITFDEETIIYHDVTSEIRRINVKNFTIIIFAK